MLNVLIRIISFKLSLISRVRSSSFLRNDRIGVGESLLSGGVIFDGGLWVLAFSQFGRITMSFSRGKSGKLVTCCRSYLVMKG